MIVFGFEVFCLCFLFRLDYFERVQRKNFRPKQKNDVAFCRGGIIEIMPFRSLFLLYSILPPRIMESIIIFISTKTAVRLVLLLVQE